MARPDRPHLESNAMGVADIVFFVLAAVAPVGVIVSLTTLSIALGAGPGVPGTYVIAGLVLALFAVGYVRMSRRMTNAGAFYEYISQGLGRVAGAAAAYVAVVAYNAATIGILGALAYFAHVTFGDVLHIHLSWQVWALIAFAVVAVLSYRARFRVLFRSCARPDVIRVAAIDDAINMKELADRVRFAA